MRPSRITLHTAWEKARSGRSIVGAINCCHGIGPHCPSSIEYVVRAVAVKLRSRISGSRWHGIVINDVTCAFCTLYTIKLDDGDILDPVGWREQKRSAPRPAVLVTQGVSRVHVRYVALACSGVNGKSDCQLVLHQWNVERGLHLAKIPGTAAKNGIPVKFIARHRRRIQDRAASCVAPEQGALRTLQDLDRSQVKKSGRGIARIIRRFVEIGENRRARTRKRIERLAAHAEAELVGVLSVLDLQAGYQRAHVLLADDVPGNQRLSAEGYDRNRHFGELLLPALRRHRDFTESLRLCLSVGGLCSGHRHCGKDKN